MIGGHPLSNVRIMTLMNALVLEAAHTRSHFYHRRYWWPGVSLKLVALAVVFSLSIILFPYVNSLRKL